MIIKDIFIYYTNGFMIIEHLFFIVGVNQLIKEDTQDPPLITDEDRMKIESDVTTQVNTVQTASVPDKLDEFKQQSTIYYS